MGTTLLDFRQTLMLQVILIDHTPPDPSNIACGLVTRNICDLCLSACSSLMSKLL